MVSNHSHLLPLVAILVLFPSIASIVNATLNAPDLIAQSCKGTKHPQLCAMTLAPFLNAVTKQDLPVANEQASLMACSVAKRVYKGISRISHQLNTSVGVDPKVLNAINLCMTHHEDAILQIEGAVRSAHDIVAKVELSSPATTFMDADYELSLACSHLGDCLQQWDNLPNSKIKTGICRATRRSQGFAGHARDMFGALKEKYAPPASPPPARCPTCMICCSSKKLAPGKCCEKCCDPEPLPSQEIPYAVMVKQSCPDPKDLACINWVKESYPSEVGIGN